jgi:hypothetical protein
VAMFDRPSISDPLFVGQVLIPALWLVLSIVIRWKKEAVQSAGADLLAAFIAFDVAVILAPTEFTRFAANQKVAAALISSHVALMFFAIVAWVFAMVVVEPKLAKARTLHALGTASSYFWGVLSWAACWIIGAAHVWNFRGAFV